MRELNFKIYCSRVQLFLVVRNGRKWNCAIYSRFEHANATTGLLEQQIYYALFERWSG